MRIYTNCSFTGNSVNFNGASGGGAMSFVNSNPTVSNCTFMDNEGKIGGAIYCRTFSLSRTFTHLFDSCTFSQNLGSENGGAIYTTHEPNPTMHFTVSHSIFDSNYTTSDLSNSGRGGACLFTGNGAAHYFVEDCMFADNVASRDAGAIYITHSTSADTLYVTVEESVFDNNDANGTPETIEQYAQAPGTYIESTWRKCDIYNDGTTPFFLNRKNLSGESHTIFIDSYIYLGSAPMEGGLPVPLTAAPLEVD